MTESLPGPGDFSPGSMDRDAMDQFNRVVGGERLAADWSGCCFASMEDGKCWTCGREIAESVPAYVRRRKAAATNNGESEMTTRAEHLAWCKKRALEYVDAGDVRQAFASFASDVTKHPETVGIRDTIGTIGMPLMLAGLLDTPLRMRNHIEGYN